jgi:hypothetical protein
MFLTGVQLDAVRHARAAAFYVLYGAPAFAPGACAHFWRCVWLFCSSVSLHECVSAWLCLSVSLSVSVFVPLPLPTYLAWQGVAIAVTGGGSLSLAGLALPAAVVITGANSRLDLDAVTVPQRPEWGTQTGTATIGNDLQTVLVPPDLHYLTPFIVISGPCTTAEGGLCVGRWPGGYLPNEDCEIAVAGVGALGPCPVFDTNTERDGDYLTLPDGSRRQGAVCPAGVVLGSGQTLTWHSEAGGDQGNSGNGLPYSHDGAGGGWQVCFGQ